MSRGSTERDFKRLRIIIEIIESAGKQILLPAEHLLISARRFVLPDSWSKYVFFVSHTKKTYSFEEIALTLLTLKMDMVA